MRSLNRGQGFYKYFLRRESRHFWIFGASLGVFTLSLCLIYFGSQYFWQYRTQKALDRVFYGLSQEEGRLEEQVREAAQVRGMTEAVSRNDSDFLSSVLSNMIIKNGLTSVRVADKNGKILLRMPNAEDRQDYVFQTTTWGRLAAEGKSSVIMASTKATPLSLVASRPILKDGEVVGAISITKNMGNDFALYFQGKYLAKTDFKFLDASARNEIVFYSSKYGVTGSSFEDRSINKTLSLYLSPNAGWEDNLRNHWAVELGGWTKLIGFKDAPPEKIGASGPVKIFVFLPGYLEHRNMAVSLASVVLFAILVLIVHRRRRSDPNYYRRFYSVIALVLGTALLVIMLLISRYISALDTIKIDRPAFRIYNSNLYLEPEYGMISVGQKQQVRLVVDTGEENINTVAATIKYNPEAAEVVGLETYDSVCPQEMFLESSVDNNAGKADVSCVIPGAGFSGSHGVVARIIFQAKKPGVVPFKFEAEAQVLASDGLATNVLRETTNANYQAVTDFNGSREEPSALHPIFSVSHPNNERWYVSREINMIWPKISPGATYYYALDVSSSTSLGKDFSSTSENSVRLSAPGDGVYYFHLARISGGKVGRTNHYKLKIDSAPPTKPIIRVSQNPVKAGDIVRLVFSSKDNTSGINPIFYISMDDSIFTPVVGQVAMPISTSGAHRLVVRAYDRAGNYSQNETFLVAN